MLEQAKDGGVDVFLFCKMADKHTISAIEFMELFHCSRNLNAYILPDRHTVPAKNGVPACLSAQWLQNWYRARAFDSRLGSYLLDESNNCRMCWRRTASQFDGFIMQLADRFDLGVFSYKLAGKERERELCAKCWFNIFRSIRTSKHTLGFCTRFCQLRLARSSSWRP